MALAAFVASAVFAVGGLGPVAAAVPPAPLITASPASPSSNRAPSWSFSGDPTDTFECRLARGAIEMSAWAPCISPTSFDLTGQPDGTHRFEVRAISGPDTGPATSSNYDLDTTPPDAPVLWGTPGPIGNDPALTWTFTAAAATPTIYDSTPDPLPQSMPSIAYASRSSSEVGDLVAFGGDERRLQSVTVNFSNWSKQSDHPTYPAGAWQHPITLKLYSVDRSGPVPAVGPLIATDTRLLDFPWRPEPDPTCPASGSTVGYRMPDGSCHFSIAVEHTFDLRSLAVDLPGEVIVGVEFNTQNHGPAPTGVAGPYNSLNLAVTRNAPSVGSNPELDAIFYNSTFGGFYADGGAGGTGTFRRDTGWSPYTPAIALTATDPPGPPNTTECRLTSGASVVRDWGPCAAPASFDLTAEPDGTYTIEVRAIDGAGNVGPPTGFDYDLDRSVPSAPVITAGQTSPGSTRAVWWSFTGDAGATFECRLHYGWVILSDWAPCDRGLIADLSLRPDGVYSFDVRATNALGTTGPIATSNYELDSTPPPAPVVVTPPPSPGPGPDPTPPAAVDPRPRTPTSSGPPPGDPDAPASTTTSTSPTTSLTTTASTTTAPPADPRRASGSGDDGADGAGGGAADRADGSGSGPWQTLEDLVRALLRHPDKTFFPASVLFIVGIFLLVQDRIDRSDPKLALAPVYPDPDLHFPPVPGAHS